MSNSNQDIIKLRKAVMSDVVALQDLVNHYAKDDIMLPKSLNQLYETLRDFVVLEKDGELIGCCALHFFWDDLAEVRSLAINPTYSKQGFGSKVLDYIMNDAVEFGVKKVFCLTLVPEFFEKHGFHRVEHRELPQKVYTDCINCVKLGKCDEIALVKLTGVQ